MMVGELLFAAAFLVLPSETVKARFDRFAADDEELYTNAIPNATAMARFGEAFPRFECPDEDIVRTYYFRWWVYRKHLRQTAHGWVVTEFLPDVSWAGADNTISCPLGHHFREGRWLRESRYLDDYLRFMMTEGTVNGPRAYVSAPAFAALERAAVTGDFRLPESLLPRFVENYRAWERGWVVWNKYPVGFRADRGLFDTIGDREGTELALSREGARPMVNATMWAEATAIAALAHRVGETNLMATFQAKADALEHAIKTRLWREDEQFFTTLAEDGTHDDVCELHGYAPFYYGMSLSGYASAWKPLVEATGFAGKVGLSFPLRRTPGFRADVRTDTPKGCFWNGPSWPYATSVALTALARSFQGPLADEMPIPRKTFADLLAQYARQHRLTLPDGRVVPWIDENLHPDTGAWLCRDVKRLWAEKVGQAKVGPRERGKDYNHSSFCDLVISGLCGIVPKDDGSFEVKPLAPATWDWWCLDGLRYHGRDYTVLYDRTGKRYGCGRGLVVLGETRLYRVRNKEEKER